MDNIEEEMEEVDYLVCAVAAGIAGADDIVGECCQCGMPIILRPPVRPKKICMKCAIEMMALDSPAK